MSLFRNDSTIETIEKACPICRGVVKGNDSYLYFCEKCNVLFKKEELVLDKSVIENIAIKKIVEKFDKTKDTIKLDQEPVKEKEQTEKKVIILKEFQESKKYFVSKKSNILHRSNCPYGKNIKKENRITLKSLEGTDELKKCRCMIEL